MYQFVVTAVGLSQLLVLQFSQRILICFIVKKRVFCVSPHKFRHCSSDAGLVLPLLSVSVVPLSGKV
jgi:hypothetical protein